MSTEQTAVHGLTQLDFSEADEMSFEELMSSGIDLVSEVHDMMLNTFADPYPTYHEMRKFGGIVEGDVAVERCGVKYKMVPDPTFSAVSYDAVGEVLRDFNSFSNAAYMPTIGRSFGRTLVMMDPPEHTQLRSLVQLPFTKKFISQLRDRMRDVANNMIDGMFADGQCEVMKDVANEFPLLTIHAMLGIPPELTQEINSLAVGLLLIKTKPAIGLACSKRLGEILRDLMEERRSSANDNMITQLMTAAAAAEPPISDENVLNFLRLLLQAGAFTTTKGIGATLVGLLTHVDQLEIVKHDASLMPRAIDEALRWESPNQFIFRVVRRDVEVAGVKIPEGAGMLACLGAGNHDPSVFPSPEQFNVMRDVHHHYAFGHGAHTCLGRNIALAEISVLVEQMMTRLDGLRLNPEKEPPRIEGTANRSAVEIHVEWNT